MNANTLMQNETFMNAVANAASVAELQEIFAKQGVEISEEEIKSAISMASSGNGDALNEEQLDNVAGGVALATCYAVLNCAMVMMAGKPLWLLATMRR